MNPPRNIAASVRSHLLNLAKQQQKDFQVLLQRYVIERLLYRMSKSGYNDQFILISLIYRFTKALLSKK